MKIPNTIEDLKSYYAKHKNDFLNDFAIVQLNGDPKYKDEKIVVQILNYFKEDIHATEFLSNGAIEILTQCDLLGDMLKWGEGNLTFEIEQLYFYLMDKLAYKPDITDYNYFLEYAERCEEIYTSELKALLEYETKENIIATVVNSGYINTDADYFNLADCAIRCYSEYEVRERMADDTDFIKWYLEKKGLLNDDIIATWRNAREIIEKN